MVTPLGITAPRYAHQRGAIDGGRYGEGDGALRPAARPLIAGALLESVAIRLDRPIAKTFYVAFSAGRVRPSCVLSFFAL